MLSSPLLSLTIPLLNEQDGVTSLTEALVATLRHAQIPTQLILVDNGSSDLTRARIEALQPSHPEVELLHLPHNQGYGGGILAGMACARAPFLGFLWGDEQVPHYAVLRCLERLRAGTCDVAKARRVVRLEGWQRKLVTRTYHTLFPLFFDCPSDDLHGCPKLFTRNAWEQIHAQSRDWFIDAEIMLRTQRLGLRLEEIPVVSWPRATGRSKVRGSTLLEFAQNVARHRLLSPHLRAARPGQGS
ncbi:MAG: glycosyltransferase family 2 protein [Myxococcota bacterium]